MHVLKKIFNKITGYWLHRKKYLPIGFILEFDIREKIGYGKVETIFDVGANIGQSYRFFRDIFGEAKIFCFEPVTSSFLQLAKSVEGDDKCRIENIAFGDQHTEIEIKLFDNNSPINSLKTELMNTARNAVSQKVQVTTIDIYCRDLNISSIDLLKIDTEGYEILVLEGCQSMINEGRIGMIYCEVGFMEKDKRHVKFNELSSLMSKYGFSFFGLYDLSIDSFYFGDYYGNALFIHNSRIKSNNE